MGGQRRDEAALGRLSKLILVDKDGRERIVLDANDLHGDARIMMRDESGITRLELNIRESSWAGVTMYSSGGDQLALIGVGPDEKPILSLSAGTEGTYGVLISSGPNTCGLSFTGEQNLELVRVGVEQGIGPHLLVRSEDGVVRLDQRFGR